MLDPKLLNLLVCPQCAINLIYRRVGKKEELECSNCHQIFKIEDSVPQLSSEKMVK